MPEGEKRKAFPDTGRLVSGRNRLAVSQSTAAFIYLKPLHLSELIALVTAPRAWHAATAAVTIDAMNSPGCTP